MADLEPTYAKALEIAKHYGLEAQLRQAMEECAEFVVAANKYLRLNQGGQPVPETRQQISDNLVEEIADVELVLYEIKDLLRCTGKVKAIKNRKAARTLERIEKEENKTDENIQTN